MSIAMEKFGSIEQPFESRGSEGPVSTYRLQCRTCGFEPFDALNPLPYCPKCRGHSWERFIVGNGTTIDGKVTAKNAQGDVVTIDIEQAGQNVSKVTIHIGATGDEAVSKQLVDKINSHLSWL